MAQARKRYGIAAIAVLAVMAAALGMGWNYGSKSVAPQPADIPEAAAPAIDFTITAEDGIRLAATYWPGARPDAPALLLLHGNSGNRAKVADNAAWFASQGYAVLTVDFRAHGESEGQMRSFGYFESRDAAAAYHWLKEKQAGAPVAAIGISLGGAALLLGDNGPLPVDAMVLQGVYPDIRRAIHNRMAVMAGPTPAYVMEPLLSLQSWPRFGVSPSRLSPLNAVSAYKGPVFVIGGGADRYTPPEETRSIHAAAPGQKQLWLLPGLDHGETGSLATSEYRQRVLTFLQQTIGKP